jgi:hypothetical protein
MLVVIIIGGIAALLAKSELASTAPAASQTEAAPA